MPDLVYCERPPAPDLAPYVECFWSLHAKRKTANVILPDGCVDLVFSPSLGLRVVGPMTRRQMSLVPEKSSVAGVRFRPGMARAFVGISLPEIKDTHVEAELLWAKRAREMHDRLDEAQSDRDLFHWLRQVIAKPPGALDAVQRCLLLLARDKGRMNLDDLLRQTNLSARQFRRRCAVESGLSPKYLNRVLRFREACALAITEKFPRWAEIASQTGYFDQSHLIRDFVEFAGAAPGMSVLSNT